MSLETDRPTVSEHYPPNAYIPVSPSPTSAFSSLHDGMNLSCQGVHRGSVTDLPRAAPCRVSPEPAQELTDGRAHHPYAVDEFADADSPGSDHAVKTSKSCGCGTCASKWRTTTSTAGRHGCCPRRQAGRRTEAKARCHGLVSESDKVVYELLLAVAGVGTSDPGPQSEWDAPGFGSTDPGHARNYGTNF